MKAPFRILGLVALLALPLASQAALQNGKLEFGIIKGKSVLFDPKSQNKPAVTGLVFEEGYRVQTAAGSNSELILSNGATLVLEPNTLLEVRTFRQVGSELIKPGQYRLLDKEPSPSVTEIVVQRGKITGEVRKLNPQSTFTIKTPVGVARVRGTVFTVEYSQNNSGGVGNIKVSVVRGLIEVSVVGSNSGPAAVLAGWAMSAQAPITLSNPVNLIAGQEIEILPPKDPPSIAPTTISYSKLDSEQIRSIGDTLAFKSSILKDTVDEVKEIADNAPPPSPLNLVDPAKDTPPDSPTSGGGGPPPTNPMDDLTDKIDKIIEKEQQTNPSPAGG